ncbi:MAG: hypothetical protein KVP17_000814 [Porospora cf. gigantea B]|uniref:uncharacterized protein n=1 Tax=Porospora cf. gigantea B TaxID=2853592 RepID=UPI003571A444|nr:MAG: hypothetical protein KVP17_000814 [Porospora cf. gigantea B]
MVLTQFVLLLACVVAPLPGSKGLSNVTPPNFKKQPTKNRVGNDFAGGEHQENKDSTVGGKIVQYPRVFYEGFNDLNIVDPGTSYPYNVLQPKMSADQWEIQCSPWTLLFMDSDLDSNMDKCASFGDVETPLRVLKEAQPSLAEDKKTVESTPQETFKFRSESTKVTRVFLEVKAGKVSLGIEMLCPEGSGSMSMKLTPKSEDENETLLSCPAVSRKLAGKASVDLDKDGLFIEAFYLGTDPAILVYHKAVNHSSNAHVFLLPTTQYADAFVIRFRSGWNTDINFRDLF